ncbi:MAG TPA: Holliday junction resolvase RuvX [Clostridiaceae bacterium]
MRVLGLDIGDKTIGIAVSDPLGYTAQGLTTIRRTSVAKDFDEIKKIYEEKEVTDIVAGLPKNMNNSLGPQSEKVIQFCKELEAYLNIKIMFQDERMTTISANRIMLEGNLSRTKRKSLVDKIAACYILEGYLNSLKNKNNL